MRGPSGLDYFKLKSYTTALRPHPHETLPAARRPPPAACLWTGPFRPRRRHGPAHLRHLQYSESNPPAHQRSAPPGRRAQPPGPTSQPVRQVWRRASVFISGPGRDAERAVDAGLRVRLLAAGQTRPRHHRTRHASHRHARAALLDPARRENQTERFARSGPGQEGRPLAEAPGRPRRRRPYGGSLHHPRGAFRHTHRRLHHRGPPGRRCPSPPRRCAPGIRQEPAPPHRHPVRLPLALAHPPRQGSEEKRPRHRRIRRGPLRTRRRRRIQSRSREFPRRVCRRQCHSGFARRRQGPIRRQARRLPPRVPFRRGQYPPALPALHSPGLRCSHTNAAPHRSPRHGRRREHFLRFRFIRQWPPQARGRARRLHRGLPQGPRLRFHVPVLCLAGLARRHGLCPAQLPHRFHAHLSYGPLHGRLRHLEYRHESSRSLCRPRTHLRRWLARRHGQNPPHPRVRHPWRRRPHRPRHPIPRHGGSRPQSRRRHRLRRSPRRKPHQRGRPRHRPHARLLCQAAEACAASTSIARRMEGNAAISAGLQELLLGMQAIGGASPHPNAISYSMSGGLYMNPLADKKADLAGPGIGDYAELEKILPRDYSSLLNPKDTQKAIFAAKNYIERNLCQELNLMMVTVPLIVDVDSGVNDYLDRDGSRTPIQFHISNDRDVHPVDAQVVQAATKWKRVALQRFGMQQGEGLCTDMRAIRKDYFLDHDHSAYVDQWDWERAITPDQRNLDFLKLIVNGIWKVLAGAEKHVQELFPQLKDPRYPNLPEQLTFLHAEEILDLYPDLPRKQRETAILQKYPAVFIIGIGWTLADGYPRSEEHTSELQSP